MRKIYNLSLIKAEKMHISYKNFKQSSTDRPTHQVKYRVGAKLGN